MSHRKHWVAVRVLRPCIDVTPVPTTRKDFVESCGRQCVLGTCFEFAFPTRVAS
eukprot:COSAG01_NODE_1349_length_10618_cov_12.745318_6_plen_54_part_00